MAFVGTLRSLRESRVLVDEFGESASEVDGDLRGSSEPGLSPKLTIISLGAIRG
jgi:hypothetical protein